ncbi:ABC transporter permease [Yoonia sp. 2307UL14-13]|uniref:ABC transporter permease n=1 Tax=Yoonia sp. 2307UL14-13 TaxID=3126506 RepID=UPI0030A57D60
MFQVTTRSTRIRGAFGLVEIIYHSIVRAVRQSHRNAIVGLLLNMVQAMTLVIAFLIMFRLLGIKGTPLRGDFLLFLMSGVFLFMTHIKAVSAVMGAEGAASPMMQHAPMNTFISISAAALSSLYIQILSLFIVLTVYHIAYQPISIDFPIPALGMFILAWFAGVAIGLVFLALRPWAPDFVSLASTIYRRVNMIASGKMFVANALPASKLALFDWNPLFHIIDQCRGYVFLHYNPHFTSWGYALNVSIVLIVIGMMGEFYTRRHVSPSWTAGR